MPFRKRTLLRKSRRGVGGDAGGRGGLNSPGFRGGRHNHHRRQANPFRMMIYFVVIIFNLWYQRQKRLKTENGDLSPPIKDGDSATPVNNKINEILQERDDEL